MKTKNTEKIYNITVVGGGLTGQLLTSILIKNNLANTEDLCWINPDKKTVQDYRVSFINSKNFYYLNNKLGCKFSSREYINIDKIEVHNINQKLPLKLKDENNHGVIVKNNILKKIFEISKNKMDIYKSRVASTEHDDLYRYLVLSDGTKIKTSLVISADGNSSALRELSKIKYVNHDLNHIIISGYLNCNRIDIHTAKQLFLEDSFIGLLPIDKNLINFVWSLDKNVLKKNEHNFNYFDEISKRLNLFFSKEKFNFRSPKTNNSKIKNLQIYPLKVRFVRIPYNERIALIGDAAHTIHPLAGQGFNLSIEDCFDICNCLEKAKSLGKDFGKINILEEYSNSRKRRKNFITLITTAIFYLFQNQNYSINKLINFSLNNLEKTSIKNIFKYLAKGY